ncbi:MAG: FAD-dependent oxidoreductase [Gammaproteobacteria bacterium]
MKRHCIILGAGWSGLSAALHLLNQAPEAFQITILEAAPQAGGRARAVPGFRPEFGLDNGQHVFLNACSNLIELYQILGIHTDQLFLKLPLEFWVNNQNFLKPAFNLEYLSRLFYSLKFKYYLDFKTQNPSLRNLSALAWLEKHQSESMIQNLWAPLSQAILSTPIEIASAQLLINTLKACFSVKKPELWLAKQDLSASFVDPALAYILRKNGKIFYNQRVLKVSLEKLKASPFLIETRDKIYQADIIINALPPWETQKLFPELKLPDFKLEAIQTIYLEYPRELGLKYPMQIFKNTNFSALRDLPWIFDRAFLGQPNILAWVNSGTDVSTFPSPETAMLELKALYPHWGQALRHKRIIEKRAAFQGSPEQEAYRPSVQTKIPNLFLAGDYTANPFPSTLEGAVLSGKLSGEKVLLSLV